MNLNILLTSVRLVKVTKVEIDKRSEELKGNVLDELIFNDSVREFLQIIF